MKNFRLRLQAMCIAMLLGVITMSAQEIRYVKENGSGSKNGSSWDHAYANIQDAINDLVNNNKTGEVWVKAGDYYPTETTEASNSPYYKSFKIPAGITVRGGFAGNETSRDQRVTVADKNFGKGMAANELPTRDLDGEKTKSGVYENKTILHGDIDQSKRAEMKWNPTKQQFDAVFYGNSYHVVWFAMNGFSSTGRANGLAKPAKLEGCVIEGGHAYTRDANSPHPHIGYGGGIYMVANSFVYNCEVRYCDASRNGGGIYMDGGGIVRRTLVHDCQALGLGTDFGYGGGICENGGALTTKTNPVVVAQSVVTNCVGRMGGGMALLADETAEANEANKDHKYAIVANSTLVNNNTAQIEAGGVYTYGGGGLASMTIVRNKCNGSGITQNGQITGRSGGVYSRDASYIGNTVIWGNECEANKDIQYADSRSSLSDTEKTKFYYSALSKADIADWSKSEKMGVLSLDDANTTEVANKGNKGYPLFENPTETAGYIENYFTANPAYDWKVFSESTLHHAGINTADLDYAGLTPAPQGDSYDMQFGKFNSRCTMGAIVSEEPLIGAKIYTDKKEAHFFVDPNYNFAMHHGTEESKEAKGQNWDLPTRFLGNVLEYIARDRQIEDINKRQLGKVVGGEYNEYTIFIHVKEGTVDNTDSYKSGRVRATSLDIPSNVTILGSYDMSLTETDLSKRNTVLTPTIISGKLLDDYKYHIAHLINIKEASNVTVDGFKITLANANSTELGNSNKNGAAITLKDCAKVDGEVTVHFKNIIVSNCYGDKGTVVYSDNSSANFENCIFHNNTTATIASNGLVYGIKSDLRFDHCNVLRSVGHASYLDADTKNEWKNSMFYGNLDRAQDNTNNCTTLSIAAFDGPGVKETSLTGERCMFDHVSRPLYDSRDANYSTKGISGINLGAGIPALSTYYVRTIGKDAAETETNPNGLEYAYTSGWANGYPRMVNPTKNAGYSTEGDVTYYGRATSFEPHNDNPVVNAAGTNGLPHDSWGLDITTIITRDFGGRPDIGAVESHIATSDQIANENGNPDGQMPYGVAYYVRDYAQEGMPQTYTLNSSTGVYTPAADGKGNYVKEGTEYVFLDGASWQYAVSGNANYGISVDVNTPVNTNWQAVNDPTAKTFNGTFKIHNGTNYFRLTVSGNNVTLTTSNEAQATVWTVSGVTASSPVDTDLSTTTHTISTTINGRTYYLYSYNSGNTNSRNFTLAKSGSGYTLQYRGTLTVYIRYNNGLTYTTQANQATSWVFDPQYTLGGWIEKEVVPSGKTANPRTAIAQGGTITNEPLDLHVYSSLTDVNNLGAANVVSYKIKLQGSTMYAYDRANNNRNLGSTNDAGTAHNFVLISTGTADQYYIYDLNSSRYVYNNNNTSIRLSATNQTPWSILVDAGNASFNIVRPGTTSAWSNAGNNQNMAYADRTNGANQEWVLVAQNGYTNKYYTETHTVGEELNGLQYAVNTVHDEYLSKKTQHQVHVGEGTYTNRTGAASGTDAAKNEVSQPYAYMMKEGVDVLGGYPTIGNPGEEQRQPKTFVTILQPSNANPYVAMTFTEVNPGQDSGYDYMKVNDSDWSAYVKKDNTQDAASFARVLVQPDHFNVQTLWDGFTIQNGFLNTAYSEKIGNALANLSPAEVRQSGGAGVLLQENGIIENCEIRNNVILIAPGQIGGNMIQTGEASAKTVNSDNIYTFITGGAGVFMSATMNAGNKTVKGVGGIVRNCQIYQNQLITKGHLRTGSRPDNVWQFGGGLYQNGGDVFNTIVHDNYAVTIEGTTITGKGTGSDKNNEMMLGAGVFVSQGNFYNNTIVNNTACTYFQNHDNHCSFGGVHVFENATIYNSLIAGNAGHWSYETWTSGTNPGNGVPVSAFVDDATDRFSRDKTKVHVKYSFVDVTHGQTAQVKNNQGTLITVDVDLVSYNDEIVDSRDEETKKIPLKTNIYLDWNQGTPLTGDDKYTLPEVYSASTYKLVEGSPCINTGTTSIWDPIAKSYVVIPDVDAAYTDRIKDCKIDIGAFESDGAATIHPQKLNESGAEVVNMSDAKQLVFYVTPEGFGRTDGSDPANAACAPKLQKVIDAAGRYKIQNPGKQVIVKVANSNALHDAQGDDFTYYATRTTDQSSTDTRMWSIQIPRGVEVWGGYTDAVASGTWDNSNNGFQTRSITGNPTYFDSYFYNKDMRINATTYHVVTFTDRIYDVNGVPFLKSDIFDVDGAGKVTGLKDGIDLTTALSTAIGNDETDQTRFAHMSDIIGTANVMAEKINGKTVSNRAVLDGIFVTGGNADGKALSGSSNLNANGYGGAAIVTDYAYVRNCIVKNNSATNGGAFALTDRAFVSGSLIIENNADNMGGGLYVFENGATLSNGIKVNSTAPDGQDMDARMAHVFTSTIVNNKAQQGGGIWYTEDLNANARFNSVVVWQNEASDQANVFGMVNPEQPTEDETLSEIFYPFSFSLIENVRASGSNNLESMPLNRQGVRFVKDDSDIDKDNDLYDMAVENETAGENTFADFGYYGLTKYSVLCSTGMPNAYYNQLKESIAIADDDILGQPRIDAENINSFIEIGARALPKRMPNKVLMLRLFVAHPDVVDTKTATQFMRLNEEASLDGAQEYYSQRGSSFAFPFNFLQDAIDYITRARNCQIKGLKLLDGTVVDGTVVANKDIVRNLPFEIVLGKGTYYPKQSLTGSTESVWAQTFAIPEGVTIIGGFNPEGGGTIQETTTDSNGDEVTNEYASYYGRYYKANKAKAESTAAGDIYTNVDAIEPNTSVIPGGNEVGRGNKFGTEDVSLPEVGTPAHGEEGDADYKPASSDYMPARTVRFQQWHIQDIADRRAMLDNNKNGIIEPWEFANQTIISGNAVNGETDGVYHIMTAVADANAVGNLPKIQSTYKQVTKKDFVGEGDVSKETGYQWHEQGQQIRLNGLIVTGGNALTYLSTALDDYGSYMFYHGAGLLVDGNHYNKDAGGTAVFHNSAAYGVGYRDIPVSVTNCQFRNNKAGYGGAISSNGSLTLFDSAFEQNMAIGQTETPADGEHWYTNISGSQQEVFEVAYPGHGGAIHATNQLSAFNTLFANNEACLGEDETPTIELVKHPTFRVPVKDNASATLRAVGGAIMMGSAANHHIVNCDFVRNKANAYPAVFTMNPTVQQNTAMDAVVDTHDYSQIINTVAWGNEVNEISENPYYKTAAKLMVNIGKKNRTTQYITDKSKKDFYNPEFKNTAEDKVYEGVPTADDLIVADPEGEPAVSGTANAWQEAAWFCAYEEGVGFKPNNTNDLRESIIYSPKAYAPTMIKAANGGTRDGDGKITSLGSYQNCNILIVADNADVAGPNFGNPSVKAGFEGFTEGADWSPSRFNRLTDNGNGWIKQTVDPATLAVTFHNDDDEPAVGNKVNFQGAYPITHYISGLTPEKQFPEYKLWLPLGREAYMRATNDMEPNNQTINGTDIGKRHKNYPRISADPTVGVQKAYIDIGVYEYQKQPLARPGSEVDILWVSTQEHPENGPANGATWKTPTSDLQRAIETLLASRNGHKKEIRIMEGEYTPVTPHTVNDTKYNAFVIDTKSLNPSAYAPSSSAFTTKSEESYAQSLTIKGGYSSEIPYAYDPVKYKTTIRQDKAVDGVSTDYLFYVADPTVRYYYAPDAGGNSRYKPGKTDGGNMDGAIVSTASVEEAKTPKAMPIQFDGITLINDKAGENISGSTIYYPDFTAASEVDGAHSVSVGGSVVYYKNKEEFDKYDAQGKHIGETSTEETDYAVIVPDNTIDPVSDVKMIISKLQVVNSGNAEDKVVTTGTVKYPSAVYVGKNGGSALIYNTVFHSNKAMPLDAWNTVNVNNTFGLNGSFARLQDVDDPKDPETHLVIKTFTKSQMHNSALWKNNEIATNSYGNQVLFGTEVPTASAEKFSYNSYTGGPSTETEGNTALANENSNIGEGPNFVDPENEDIELRNFDLKPSIRLLNKGMDTSLEAIMEDAVDKNDGNYYTKVVKNKYDFSLASTTDVDILNRPRLKANRIDIGAYEFQGSLSSILYVDPNKSHSDEATGENWDKAFGYGDLQDAVDLASISHATNMTEESYVFVKGNSSTNTGQNTNETLTLRDGVTVYGSIGSDYIDWHDIKDPNNPGQPKYRKSDGHGGWVYDIDAYIADMKSKREGVASNAASKTIVTGIKTSDGSYDGTTNNTPALVDGFVVTDPNSPKTPVLDITNTSEDAVIVVRNVIVADNDMTKASDTEANIDVAKISNGLIYEALFRDNKAKGTGAVLRVSNYTNTEAEPNYTTKGYAVNVTVEGKTEGADNTEPVDGMKSKTDATNVESATQIFKSITNSIDKTGTKGAYGNITNKGISGYFYNIADPNLNYQLTETSKYIDMCELDQVTVEGEYKGHPNFLPDNLKKFINYDTDRDLLGNPRFLARLTTGAKIDRGAFETWRVDNDFVCGKWTDSEHVERGTNADREIGAQFYPHDGSVVYVMENKSLVIDPLHEGEEIKPTPENPGFLLVKEGGNFYGNGRPVTAAYVAIERNVPANGAIVSVPYAMKYRANVAKNTTPAGEDLVLLADAPSEARYYDGSKRSDWKHIFQKEYNANDPSNCWAVIDDNDVTATNNGVFYKPGETHAAGTYRFTAQGASLTDYIYTENGDSKEVTLTKYDDAESTGNGADYTDNLDMGWNCFGIPYLVSEYKPYEKVGFTDIVDSETSEVIGQTYGYKDGGDYMMNIPHTLWLYYNGTQRPDKTAVDGDGGYYSVKAWKSENTEWHIGSEAKKALWVGEGIFTQTATLKDTEALTFYRPVAPNSFSSSAKGNVRYFYDATGVVEIDKDPAFGEDGYAVESTEYYTVNGMKIDKPRHGVVIIRETLTNGKVRTIKRTFK